MNQPKMCFNIPYMDGSSGYRLQQRDSTLSAASMIGFFQASQAFGTLPAPYARISSEFEEGKQGTKQNRSENSICTKLTFTVG